MPLEFAHADLVRALTMRRMKTSLPDLTAQSRIAQHMKTLLPVMIPETA